MSHSPKIGTRRWLIFSLGTTVIMILYANFVLGYFSECFSTQSGPNALGLLIGYTIQEVTEFLNSRSNEQLICYLQFISVWDIIFPIIYSLMHISWMVYLSRRWTLAVIIPVLHVLADWFENIIEAMIVKTYMSSGKVTESLVEFGSTLTISKWVLSSTIYLIILIMIGFRLKGYFGNKNVLKRNN